MVYKLEQLTLTPGQVLLLPTKNEDHSSSSFHIEQDPKDQGIGIIVSCTPREAMPMQYENNYGGGTASRVKPDHVYAVGESVLYQRVSSQAVMLEDGNGELLEYRCIHEDAILGYFEADAV